MHKTIQYSTTTPSGNSDGIYWSLISECKLFLQFSPGLLCSNLFKLIFGEEGGEGFKIFTEWSCMFHQIFFNQWNRSLDRCLSNDQWATPHLYLDDEQSDIVWLSEGISPGVGLLHLIDRTRAWHQATQTGQTIIKTGRAGRATIFNVATRDNASMQQCIKASVIHTKIIFFLAYWVTMEFWHNIYR